MKWRSEQERCQWFEYRSTEGIRSLRPGIKKDDVTDEGVGCIRYGEIYTKYNDYFFIPISRIPLSVATGALADYLARPQCSGASWLRSR